MASFMGVLCFYYQFMICDDVERKYENGNAARERGRENEVRWRVGGERGGEGRRVGEARFISRNIQDKFNQTK